MFSSSAVRHGSCRAFQLNSLLISQWAPLSTLHSAATRHEIRTFHRGGQDSEGRDSGWREFSRPPRREFEGKDSSRLPRSEPKGRDSSRRQSGKREFLKSSTRSPTSSRSLEEGNTARPDVPRYIRRQGMHESRNSVKGNQNEHSGDINKPLDPYILAKRLRQLCEEGKIDDAVTMLKNAPRDAMNTIVWNTMIWEAMKTERFQLAHSLYIDMKRRGLSPTTRTYQTMFGGLSRIERWNTYTKQLSNARSLYEDFQRHIASLKEHEPYSPDITPNPLVGYIKILGNAGEYQEIFDVYYSLDPEGPYSANEFIYTASFQALADMRRTLHRKSIAAPSAWGAKVASDTRMLWNYMLKASKEKQPGLADPYTATAAISALSQGESVDHNLAFDIVHRYFGLSRHEVNKVGGHFPLGRKPLGAILKLCNEAGEHSACLHFFQLVKRSSAVGMLDRLHVEEVLKARYQLQTGGMGSASLQLLEWMLHREQGDHGPHIRPSTSTYNLVLSACWKGADWPSATIAFNLMTGHHAEEFSDEAVAKGFRPRFDKRERGRNIWPSSEALSSLMRTAVATKQRSNVRACMRLIDHIGLEQVLPKKAGLSFEDISPRNAKSQLFYASKLAQAVGDGWELISGYANECGQEELQRWRALKDKCSKDYNRKPTGYTPTKLD